MFRVRIESNQWNINEGPNESTRFFFLLRNLALSFTVSNTTATKCNLAPIPPDVSEVEVR